MRQREKRAGGVIDQQIVISPPNAKGGSIQASDLTNRQLMEDIRYMFTGGGEECTSHQELLDLCSICTRLLCENINGSNLLSCK